MYNDEVLLKSIGFRAVCKSPHTSLINPCVPCLDQELTEKIVNEMMLDSNLSFQS